MEVQNVLNNTTNLPCRFIYKYSRTFTKFYEVDEYLGAISRSIATVKALNGCYVLELRAGKTLVA